MHDAAVGGFWALLLAGADGPPALAGGGSGGAPALYRRRADGRTPLEASVERVAPLVGTARTVVLLNRERLPRAASQLVGLPPANVFAQPRSHDTGPDLLYALLKLHELDPEARVVALPAYHEPGDEREFRADVRTARWALRRHPDKIVLLGVPPERPDRDHGYVEPGPVALEGGVAPLFAVRAFHEKPDPRLARYLIAAGSLWSSFVLVFGVARMLVLLGARKRAQLDRLAPSLSDPRALQAAYGSLQSWSFSRDFLARATEHLLVLRTDARAAAPATGALQRVPPARAGRFERGTRRASLDLAARGAP